MSVVDSQRWHNTGRHSALFWGTDPADHPCRPPPYPEGPAPSRESRGLPSIKLTKESIQKNCRNVLFEKETYLVLSATRAETDQQVNPFQKQRHCKGERTHTARAFPLEWGRASRNTSLRSAGKIWSLKFGDPPQGLSHLNARAPASELRAAATEWQHRTDRVWRHCICCITNKRAEKLSARMPALGQL